MKRQRMKIPVIIFIIIIILEYILGSTSSPLSNQLMLDAGICFVHTNKKVRIATKTYIIQQTLQFDKIEEEAAKLRRLHESTAVKFKNIAKTLKQKIPSSKAMNQGAVTKATDKLIGRIITLGTSEMTKDASVSKEKRQILIRRLMRFQGNPMPRYERIHNHDKILRIVREANETRSRQKRYLPTIMKMATTIGQMIHKIPIKQIARVATPALLGASLMADIGDLTLDKQSQYAMEKAPIPTSGMSSLFSLTNTTTPKSAPEGIPKEEYGFNLLDLKFMPSIPSNSQSDSISTDDIQTVPPGMELKYQDSYGTLKKETPVHW